jgi:DNA-binding NtrC family response regulator
MVREGRFRQDLYFRLNVVRLTIQPLRERSGEILPLAHHFVEDIAIAYDEPIKTLSPAAEAALIRYDWPGNVRELRNAIERAFLFCSDRTIDVIHLPEEVRDAIETFRVDGAVAGPGAIELQSVPRLADAERLLIARVLTLTGGNQSDAARLLDVERHRLRRKIVSYGLEHLARVRPR